jgi:hypothetical protein
LLEVGIGAAPPCPSLQLCLWCRWNHHRVQPTALLPRLAASNPQSLEPLTPQKVGWYRRLIFELTKPVVLSAEYMAYLPYIYSAFTPNRRIPETAARMTTPHYWCRLWSPKMREK